MGNTCTLVSKKEIAVPQIVHVLPNSKNQKVLFAHSLGVKHDGQSLTPTRARSNPSEPHTAGGGDIDELKTNYTYRPLTSKYDLHELGIGEYYLEKQLLEIQNKKSPKKRRAQIKASTKWDRAVVEMRVKFPQNSQDGLFYTQIDVCLKEYASLKPKSFAKMLKEGPPMRYRWSVWKNFLEPDQFYVSELYEKYLNLSSPYETDIKKDTHRTFPNEPYFSEKFNSIGQDQLFNVLKAISLYLPNIGYAQGMNFLAAFLLLVNGGNELEAFWSFVSLARDHRFLMMGFFEKGFPLMNFYIFVFYEMLEAELPGLHEHIKQQQVPDELWLVKWFFTIFLYSLPPKLVIRIWDFVMVEGLLGIIKVSLGFLKVVEKDVLQLDAIGMDLLFEYLKNEGNRITNISHTSNIPPQNQSNANNNNNQSNVQLHNQSNNNFESPIQVVNITDGTYANINPIQVENITTINVNQSNISNHSMPQIPSQNINHTHLTQRDNLGSVPVSVNNETTEIQYSIKELDIDEVLDHAEKIVLTVDRLLYFVDLYPEKTHRVLPNPYNHFFKNIHIYQKDISKLAEFQTEIDFHLMKSELSDKPNDEIVISNLLNETGNTNILKDLVL